jgi:hypothetical protein
MKPFIFPPEQHRAPKNLYRAIRHELWMLLGRHESTLQIIRPLERRTDRLGVVSRGSDIVIEGYPRSANTFAQVAFQIAQDERMMIAHHIHGPAQVTLGLRWRIPTLIIIRNPLDAIASLLVRYPFLNPSLAFRNYYLFYHSIEPYLPEVVLASFEEVVSNYGMTIDRVNRKFGAHFGLFKHTPGNVDKCYMEIDRLDMQEHGGLKANDRSVARPSSERDEARKLILDFLGAMKTDTNKAKAMRIYKRFSKGTELV